MMVTTGKLYHGATLLADDYCAVSPNDWPDRGSIMVPAGVDWLSFEVLRLVLDNGTEYRVSPTDLQQFGDVPGLLFFTIRPPAETHAPARSAGVEPGEPDGD